MYIRGREKGEERIDVGMMGRVGGREGDENDGERVRVVGKMCVYVS